jgi:hypothetical protein
MTTRLDDLSPALQNAYWKGQSHIVPEQYVAEHSPCNKLAYRSRKKANSARQIINHNSRVLGKKPKMKRAYHCPRCNFWHLTSRQEKPKKRAV